MDTSLVARTRRRPGLDIGWVLTGNLVMLAISGVWMLAQGFDLRPPMLLGLLPVPIAFGFTVVGAFLTARSPGSQPAARRFWYQMTFALSVVAAGATINTYSTMQGIAIGAVNAPPAGTALLVVGILTVMWALMRLPVGSRTPAEWLRITLDAATVTLAAALALWHLALRPLIGGNTELSWLFGLLLIAVVCLVALVAIMKVMLVGSGPVYPGSLQLLALTVLVGGLTSATAPLVAEPRWLGLQPFPTVLDAALVCWAAHRQYHANGSAGTSWPDRPKRSYSLLPYVGVAATFVLLAVVAVRGDKGIGVIVAGAAAVTAVVVLRQIVAFRDNARLLGSVREHERQLRHQASHDALTQLPNRSRFGEYVSDALAAPAGAPGLAVLLIDLDDFKAINDTLGHAVGDGVIIAVAERLQEAMGEGEMVARFGGDEFAALLRDRPDRTAVETAELLLAVLTQPVDASGYRLLVRASIGVAEVGGADDLDTLLRNADIAMYAGKERGKGSVVRFSADLAARVHAHAELGAQLREAIGTAQVSLAYQPIVRMDDGTIVGTEALVRWRHPVRGPVTPAEFIPTAERTGLIIPLGRWVLREACRQAADWLARYGGDAPYSISVNVAGAQLWDPAFVSDVVAALADADLPARHLMLEVTETAVLDGVEIATTLRELRNLGIGLALDDFGTAASSLGLLLTCPVTTLKLDRSFVEGITTVERQAAVAKAVIHIAQALELNTVAEGIEYPEQAAVLRQLGYEHAQGYMYAKPLAPAELEAMLTSRSLAPITA